MVLVQLEKSKARVTTEQCLARMVLREGEASRSGGVLHVRAEDGGGFECPCGVARAGQAGQGLVKDYGCSSDGFVGVANRISGSGEERIGIMAVRACFGVPS